MNELEMLRRYSARSAQPPHVDVTADVLATLRHNPRAADSHASLLRPLVSVAAAGWLVALSIVFFAEQAWTEVLDPLSALVAPFVVSLQ
jgi:hypothetical protein